ncbi:MAG: type VI secretion system tip protein VgrG [Xanthomonadaceae bacterium]|jgi:type VI secretion system secreted protein VgrG|nr:type VI secretion system tip protein VgrG [Xanthomonadaceae bacterium]
MATLESTAFLRKQTHSDIPRSTVAGNALPGSSSCIDHPASASMALPGGATDVLGTLVDFPAQALTSFDHPIDPVVARIAPLAGAVSEWIQSPGDTIKTTASTAASALIPDTAAPVVNTAVTQLLDIDNHFHTGRSIVESVSTAADYAPPRLDPKQWFDSAPTIIDLLNTSKVQLEDRDRLLRFYSPLDGERRLYLDSLQGQAELSCLGGYSLHLVSTHAAIDLQDLLGKNVTAGIVMADGDEHPINGYVTAFGFDRTDGGLAHYTAEVTPWCWYLTKRVNSRIFQSLSALDVVERIFDDYGALADYEVRVAQPPPVEDYIVQYQESDFDFVSRLLEKCGLFYYFSHRADGHTLIIADDSCADACCPLQPAHSHIPFNDGDRVDTQDSIRHLSTRRAAQIGAVALNTYDYKQPRNIPYLRQPTLAVQGDIPSLEIYDGNPAFAYRSLEEGHQEAKRRLEIHEWQAKLFFAESECRGIRVGHTFTLERHHWFERSEAGNNEFLVIGMQLEAENNFANSASDARYRNRLTLIRRKIPYRPQRQHAKPVMRGPQSATVVGPAGQEIHTDTLGRIKVQFPWDRHGRFDDGSSCWIRVSQPWSGRGWGTVAIPRIGQEVIVDFFEGDPDRPVVVGRLYNSEQTAPYALPDGAHMMGFHSNSTPGGGGHCEMVIHDKQGEELINIHSQKDLATTVQDAETHTVKKGNRSVTLEMGDEIKTLMQGNRSVTLNVGDETKALGQGNRRVTLDTGDETKTLGQGSLTETISKNRKTVASTIDCNATGGGGECPGEQHYTADNVIVHRVGAGTVTMTKERIEIKFGPSTIVLAAGGISIDGPIIDLNSDKAEGA